MKSKNIIHVTFAVLVICNTFLTGCASQEKKTNSIEQLEQRLLSSRAQELTATEQKLIEKYHSLFRQTQEVDRSFTNMSKKSAEKLEEINAKLNTEISKLHMEVDILKVEITKLETIISANRQEILKIQLLLDKSAKLNAEELSQIKKRLINLGNNVLLLRDELRKRNR